MTGLRKAITCTLFPTNSERSFYSFSLRVCVRACSILQTAELFNENTLGNCICWTSETQSIFLTFKFLPPSHTHTHKYIYIYIYMRNKCRRESVPFWVSGSFLPTYNVPHPREYSSGLHFCYKLNRHTGGVRLEEGPCQVNLEFLANGSLYISFKGLIMSA